MGGLGGVNEQRRSASGGEGRSDLAGNMARFSDPGDNDTLLAAQDHLDRLPERVAKCITELAQGISLHSDNTTADLYMARAHLGIAIGAKAGGYHLQLPLCKDVSLPMRPEADQELSS
jgi:hypothetical protein